MNDFLQGFVKGAKETPGASLLLPSLSGDCWLVSLNL